jgi:hypothetical protein
MRISRSIVVGCFCLLWLCMGSASFGASGYLLENGSRAVVEGKRLILVERNGKRSVAAPGRYETRDGRHTIVVKGDVVIILAHDRRPR